MKTIFLVPYFGHLPESFQFFLDSCSNKTKYDWLVITDDSFAFRYPSNVQRIIMTFEELREYIQSKFSFPIALSRPYKLCDLKPMYGFIFSEYTVGYDFWGHCDIDTVIGDLDHLIDDEVLRSYDKLFCLGHMALYKNTLEVNSLFKSVYKGEKLYRKVLGTEAICWFDEEWRDDNNINHLFFENGYRVYTLDMAFNISTNYTKFRRTRFYYQNRKGCYSTEDLKDALYLFNDGHCYRLFVENGKLKEEEYLYYHFQQRKMRFSPDLLGNKVYKIVPNSFRKIERIPVTLDEFYHERRNYICFYGLQRKIRKQNKEWKRRINKLKTILRNRLGENND